MIVSSFLTIVGSAVLVEVTLLMGALLMYLFKKFGKPDMASYFG